MNKNRVKFSEISEAKDFISLLINERDFTNNKIIEILTRIETEDYAEDDDELFAVTLDELNYRLKEEKKELRVVNNSIDNYKLKLKILAKDKNKIISKYKSNANSIEFKHGKKQTESFEVNGDTIGKTVMSIRYNINHSKDRLDWLLIFDDGTIYVSSTGLDKLILIS